MPLDHLAASLDRLLANVSRATGEILDRALSDQDITIDEATHLFDAGGSDLMAMIAAADCLRARTVGDVVTYVINRNINFTNVCVKACGFCAFSRGHLAEEGYFLPFEEILRRAHEARELGATEVCVKRAWHQAWTVGITSISAAPSKRTFPISTSMAFPLRRFFTARRLPA